MKHALDLEVKFLKGEKENDDLQIKLMKKKEETAKISKTVRKLNDEINELKAKLQKPVIYSEALNVSI